jgi:hypothetical protein
MRQPEGQGLRSSGMPVNDAPLSTMIYAVVAELVDALP